MTHLRLTLACEDYDRTRSIKDGIIRAEGIELNYLTMMAPLAAIDSVENATRLSFDEGCRKEAELFLTCLYSDQSKAMGVEPAQAHVVDSRRESGLDQRRYFPQIRC